MINRDSNYESHRIRSVFKTLTHENLIWLFLFSFLISCCLFSIINPMVDSVFHKSELKLTLIEKDDSSFGNEIWIYQIDGQEITQELFDSIEKTGEWEYRSSDDWGYAHNFILSATPGSTLTIPISQSTIGGVSIWCQSCSGQIVVETGEGIKTDYNLFSEEGANLQITPYSDNHTGVFIRVFAYILVTIIIFALFVALLLLAKLILPFINNIVPNYKYWQVVLGLFVAIMTITLVWWKSIGIPNYPGYGDGFYYWKWGWELARPNLSNQEVVDIFMRIPTFRGYGIFVPHFIAHFLSFRFNLNPFIVYFVVMSMVCAYFSGYLMPRLAL